MKLTRHALLIMTLALAWYVVDGGDNQHVAGPFKTLAHCKSVKQHLNDKCNKQFSCREM